MRTLILFFLFCIPLSTLSAQSLIQQAKDLRSALTPFENGRRAKIPSTGPKREKAKKLLGNYFVMYDCDNSAEHNPFINCDDNAWILVDDLYKEGATADSRNPPTPFVPDITGGAGATVTNIADGLARFLVKRTKEELSIAFFRKFKERIDNDTYMRELFPATKGVLLTIDNQIYFYQAYIGALRTAFDQDLKTLPEHLRTTLQEEKIIKNDLSSIIVEDLLGAAQLQIEGQPAPDFFRYFAQDASIQDTARVATLGAKSAQVHDLAVSMQLAYLLSESLRSDNANTGNPWMTKGEIREILSDPITLHLYLGLLWQNGANIKFSNGTTLRGLLASIANVANKKESIRQEVLRLADYGAEISRGIDSVSVHTDGKLTYDQYYPVINGSLRILEQGIRFRQLINKDTTNQKFAEDCIAQLQHFQDMNFYLRQRDYVNAIMQVISVLDYFCKDNIPTAALLKYGTFIASVGQAESGEEVEQAIELFALPPGSSSLKKQSAFSISLNAYTGLSYGRERLTNVAAANQDANVAAVSSPVGLAFNVGFKKYGSATLYTSIIDVGALTAYRFKDPNSNDLPNLAWSNIIAPGVFLIYGAPAYLPLSVGFGVQSGPNLRDVNLPIQTTRALRALVFLNVDIPITYFYN